MNHTRTINASLKFTIAEWSESYIQDSDCCDSNDLGQFLELKTADGGGGPYIIIKTERWAIDPNEIDAFTTILKKFINRNSDTIKNENTTNTL